jgi:mannose-6-phosphate isomerase-like protein (cupin superfamily)
MNRIFEPRGYFSIPDGTDISPFLNAYDVNQMDLPSAALGEFSIAAGRVGAHQRSWIHVHPIVSQVTYVVSGNVTFRMKDPGDSNPYVLETKAGQAVVTRPGTLFQLQNDKTMPAGVLYIVSPPYLFDMDGDRVEYDDAVLVARSWEELELANYDVPALRLSITDVSTKRYASLKRLASRQQTATEGSRVAGVQRETDHGS